MALLKECSKISITNLFENYLSIKCIARKHYEKKQLSTYLLHMKNWCKYRFCYKLQVLKYLFGIKLSKKHIYTFVFICF